MSYLATFILSVLATLGTYGIVSAPQTEPIVGADNVLPIAGVTYNLAGSGVSASASSLTLASLTIPQTGQKIQDSDLSATFYITLEPGNRTRQEVVSCTTVTQNANDTATLSGCSRGLSPITPYTASSTLQFAHAGGSQVIFSNPPQLYNQFAAKDNEETITGQWTFSTFPITASNSTSSETVSGVVELATGAEAAAGTSLGETGGRLVLPASLATSTFSTTTSGNRIPVTNSDGQIEGGFLQQAAPIGSVTAYASSTAPTGWLLANGSAVSRTTYVSLFNIIGTTYGSGDGSTTFNLPNITGRSIVMASSTQVATSTTDGTANTRSTIGYKGGETMHTQTENELVAHTHTDTLSEGSGPNQGTGSPFATISDGTTGSTGGTTPFNVLDPYIVLNYIIKY